MDELKVSTLLSQMPKEIRGSYLYDEIKPLGVTNYGGYPADTEIAKQLRIAVERATCPLQRHFYNMGLNKARALVKDLSLEEGAKLYVNELGVPDNGWGHHPEGSLYTCYLLSALKSKFGDKIDDEIDKLLK